MTSNPKTEKPQSQKSGKEGDNRGTVDNLIVSIIAVVLGIPVLLVVWPCVALFNQLDRWFGWERHIGWFDGFGEPKNTTAQEKRPQPPRPTIQDTAPASPYEKGKFSNLDKKLRDKAIEWGNGELADFGQMFDQWSDLIDGIAFDVNPFAHHYSEAMKRRLPPDTLRSGGFLTTLGFNPHNRSVELIQRGDVTIAVLIAKQGSDLYVSWRAYVKGLLSTWRIVLVAIAVCIAFVVNGAIIAWYNEQLPSWADGLPNWPGALIFPGYILARLIVFEGMLRRRDWWGWFRDPIIPLQQDNALALSQVVHRSILEAADQAGLDSARLQPRQPPIVLRKPLI